MKISKLFHWLYASVMFLPLVIIPLFGIWSINHDHNEPITIDVTQNIIIEPNQYVRNGDFETTSYWDTNASLGSFDIENNILTYTTSGVGSYPGINQYNVTCNLDHYYVIRADFTGASRVFLNWGGYNSYLGNNLVSTDYYTLSRRFKCTSNQNILTIFLNQPSGVVTFQLSNICLFDLTQMFGVGFEPTLDDFNAFYDEVYYPYSVGGEKLYIKDYTIFTYDETDVGSQYLYTLYNSTENYLNFDSVLNLGAISDWINQNVFNGNAPLVFYIVWHYLDYWLILSIFWLCFDVLIYVPNIAHRWLDKASLE